MTPNQRLAADALASWRPIPYYVDEAGRLVIDGQAVCPWCFEDLDRCGAVPTSTVHDEAAELAAEAGAAPALTVRLGGGS